MRYLKDPIWQFVGVIVAIVAIFVGWRVVANYQPSKGLQVEILSNSPLVSVDSAISQEIIISYKGIPVHSLSLILLRLENTGNEPITEIDYSEPIRIVLSPTAEIGEAVIQESNPEGITFNLLKISSNTIELSKVLLNPGDQIVLKILAIDNDNTLNISSRIAGIRNIEIKSLLDNESSQIFPPPVFWIIELFAVFILLSLLWETRKVIEWRKNHLGYDPARAYYIKAQNEAAIIPFTIQRVKMSVYYLSSAFSWDINYLEKAEKDPMFSRLRAFEAYKQVIDKYTKLSNKSDG